LSLEKENQQKDLKKIKQLLSLDSRGATKIHLILDLEKEIAGNGDSGEKDYEN